MLTEPPMLSNLRPDDLNSLLSEICKAPPMDFKLGKSNSVKSSFLLIVNELPIEVNSASSTFQQNKMKQQMNR